MASLDSFKCRKTLTVGDKTYRYFSLKAAEKHGLAGIAQLPFSLKVVLENLLRNEDGGAVKKQDIEAVAAWLVNRGKREHEIAFRPARVLMQDFTGVPAVVDLAAMRDAMAKLGGDPDKINPLIPVDLVIDHSVIVDYFGAADALKKNVKREYEQNQERYRFLKWGQQAFANFSVVPPGAGICHQVNLEYLAQTVWTSKEKRDGKTVEFAYPDTLVGTDSHTTMVNGLAVLGWGVGGIEAEAAMLGQPLSMLLPEVIGFKLTGELREGVTATDLVLTVTQMLRRKGVVGKFVEFFGPGLHKLPLADRATIANMGPEYGATCGIFPVDEETLRYLRLSGRSEEQVQLVEAYCKEQGLFHTASTPEAEYTSVLELDLATVEPCIAGPKRPQDRVLLSAAAKSFEQALPGLLKPGQHVPPKQEARWEGEGGHPAGMDSQQDAVEEHVKLDKSLNHGSVVIAAITSCTNTSNPYVLVAAGLLAKKAVEKGLSVPAWVKTSLAPGSMVVTEYLTRSGLMPYLEKLKFHLVGYGCTTCIGNSGPLPQEVSNVVIEKDLVVASVLSGNRNFEGRINSEVRANYLMSPPLVVAYALAGRIDLDMLNEPLGFTKNGKRSPVFLKDIWPTSEEVDAVVRKYITGDLFQKSYSDVFKGDERWRSLAVPQGETFAWDQQSTYVKNPPYFDNMPARPAPVKDIAGARVLCYLGNSVTTDHISPAGSIKPTSPAGQYLIAHNVKPVDFNSYGSRRGNHEVMMRGTFANVRLRNKLTPEREGAFTRHLPDGEEMTIFDASEKYRAGGTPLMVLAGKEYGSGSSRDWAAKGPRLLGVRAVLAESFERIHRSNLVGMGILPLQFPAEENAETNGLTGEETFDIVGLTDVLENFAPGKTVKVRATKADGRAIEIHATVRIDTPQEVQYYKHGGILQYVLRQLQSKPEAVTA